MSPADNRAVTTYDFSNINLTIYEYTHSITTTLSPNQAIMLAQQLLTNALLCQHYTHASHVANTDTTSPSQTAATPGRIVGDVVPTEPALSVSQSKPNGPSPAL